MWDRVEELIQRAITQRIFPGAVLTVGKNNEMLFEKAFGMRSIFPDEANNDVDTIYDMASVTKVFATTSAIMLLLYEGKLTLQDPIQKYLGGDRSKESTKIYHLLTHTSGMPPYSELWKHKTGDDLLNALLSVRAERQPGKRVIYSCLNFIMLMRIVERITGKAFDEYCLNELFVPLGLADTCFRPSLLSRVAPTSQREGRVLTGRPDDELCYYLGGVSGNAGLFSTARDTLTFLMGLWRGEIFPQRITKRFTEELVFDAQNPRHLGWQAAGPGTSSGDLLGSSAFGHTGFTGTSAWFDPESEVAVVFLTNRTHLERRKTIPHMLEIRRKLHNIIYAGLS